MQISIHVGDGTVLSTLLQNSHSDDRKSVLIHHITLYRMLLCEKGRTEIVVPRASACEKEVD